VRVIGIDPSLTSTGLVVLETWREWREGSDVRCVLDQRMTIRTHAQETLPARLVCIAEGVESFVRDEGPDCDGRVRVVLEDPTDFQIRFPSRLRGHGALAKVGAAFAAAYLGACRATASDTELVVETVPSQVWIPRGTKHARHRELLQRAYPTLARCNDDETFAAGVALWWVRANLELLEVAHAD